MTSNRSAMIAAMQAVQRPVLRRLRALASRALIARVDDSAKLQAVQVTVLAGERLDDVQRIQNFGHSAVPPAGSTCLLISIAGSRTHCVVIGGEHSSRPRDLAPGESQLYNDQGDYIWLKTSGEIVVKARSIVTVDAPSAHFTGEIIAAGRIKSETAVEDPLGTMQEMRDDYNAHRHPGVQTGGGTSGVPNVPMS